MSSTSSDNPRIRTRIPATAVMAIRACPNAYEVATIDGWTIICDPDDEDNMPYLVHNGFAWAWVIALPGRERLDCVAFDDPNHPVLTYIKAIRQLTA